MSEWRTVKVRDLVKTNVSSYSKSDKWEFVNYLDTGNITANSIDAIQKIDLATEKLPSRAKRKVCLKDIVYSTVRPNQRHYGIIKSIPENFLVSTGFAVLHANSEKVNPDYLYFLLSQNDIVDSLHAIAEQSVSAYPSLKPSDIENLEITIPDLDTQNKIASVLMSIAAKIEKNNEINNNLPPHLCVAQIDATQRRQIPKTDGCLHTDGEVSGRGGNLKAPQVFSSLRAA